LRPKTFLKNLIYAFKTPEEKIYHALSGVPKTGSSGI
jgi:hypothetical protein